MKGCSVHETYRKGCSKCAEVQPARCHHCGYTPDAIPSDFDAYAQANCEHRESHAGHAPRAPAALSLNRRQRRCIRNVAERFDFLGYAFGAELRECFPEAFAGEVGEPNGWTFWTCGICGVQRPDCVKPVLDEECGDACPEHYEAGEVGK